jgi:hypothetical protein
VQLTDFGIAQAEGNWHRTRTGRVRGKYAYMAPEQLAGGQRVDGRADIFALCVTLFETLTGVSPFGRGTEAETMDAVREAKLPDPLKLRHDLGETLAGLLTAGVSRDPQTRPTLARLRAAFSDGPVAAPEELGGRVRRLCGADLPLLPPMESAPPRTSTDARGGPDADPSRDRFRPFVVLTLVLCGVAGMAIAWASSREPAPVPARVPTQAPTPAPPRMTTVPVASPPPTARGTRKAKSSGPPGYLSVDAKPWGRVFIDGKEIDQTPLWKYPLRPGEHWVVLRNPSFPKEIRRRIRVRSAMEATLKVDFTQ